jgi:hypothetical protein
MAIIDNRDFFSMIVTLSGSGNTSRTGKSLMTNMWQLTFLGEKPLERLLKVTEANVFDLLDQGIPIYRKYGSSSLPMIIKYVSLVREWTKHEAILNLTIPMIYERLCRYKGSVYQIPMATMHVDANLAPKDIKLVMANESKVVFINTGPKVNSGFAPLNQI